MEREGEQGKGGGSARQTDRHAHTDKERTLLIETIAIGNIAREAREDTASKTHKKRCRQIDC